MHSTDYFRDFFLDVNVNVFNRFMGLIFGLEMCIHVIGFIEFFHYYPFCSGMAVHRLTYHADEATLNSIAGKKN